MDELLQICARAVIRHLNGDYDKFNYYVNKALAINNNLCKCGGETVNCKYEKQAAKLCTRCGIITVNRVVVKKCLVNSRRVS